MGVRENFRKYVFGKNLGRYSLNSAEVKFWSASVWQYEMV